MRIRILTIAIVASGLISVAPASAQDAENAMENAYSRLSPEMYVQQLRDLGMVELAEAYVARLADRNWPQAQIDALLAGLALDKISLPNQSEADKIAHLDQAAALYRKALDAMKPKDFIGRIDKLETQYELLRVIVDLRANLYVNRLKLLRGSQADREELLALLKEPVFDLEDLVEDVQVALDRLSSQGATVFVVAKPRLEKLLLNAKYTLAWAYAHQARIYNPQDDTGKADRKLRLQEAITLAQEFADDEASSVRWQSQLLIGICQRELGLYDEAFAALSTLAGNGAADNLVRAEAMFEAARALAEQGKVDEVKVKADAYRQQAIGLVVKPQEPPDKRKEMEAWVALNAATLDYYALTKAGQGQAAQQPLINVLEEFRDYRGSIYVELADMCRGQSDFENIPSVFLLSIGATERRKSTDEGRARARSALETLLARNDAESSQLHTAGRTELAAIDGGSATTWAKAREQYELARKAPTDPQAINWAHTAVWSMNKLIDDEVNAGEQQDVVLAHRKEFIEAAKLLLSQDQWLKDKPDLADYYYDLGLHTEELAEAAGDSDTRVELLKQAIDYYEKVPRTLGDADNTFRHMYSRRKALEHRVTVLRRDMNRARTQEGRDAARDLRRMLRDYANQAQLEARRLPEGEQRTFLILWGSSSDLQAAELLNDPLDNPGGAGLELSQLPDKWGNEAADILQLSAELEIRILIQRGMISEAIAKIKSFRDKYADKADALVAVVVREIRAKITELRYDDPRGELKGLRTNFNELAGELYKPVADKPIGERYAQTQIYAESLLEVGRNEDARQYFEECRQYRQDEGAKLVEQLMRENNRKLEELKRIERIPETAERRAQTKDLTDEFLAEVAQAGLVLPATERELAAAWAIVDNTTGKTDDEQKDDLARISRLLRQGFSSYYERPAPVDPVNEYGLARCKAALGEYEEAAQTFTRLSRKFDRAAYPDLYWPLQLERVRCSFEAYKDDLAKLSALQTLIKQIDLESRHGFGGPQYKVGFEMLRQKLDNLLKAPTPTADAE